MDCADSPKWILNRFRFQQIDHALLIQRYFRNVISAIDLCFKYSTNNTQWTRSTNICIPVWKSNIVLNTQNYQLQNTVSDEMVCPVSLTNNTNLLSSFVRRRYTGPFLRSTCLLTMTFPGRSVRLPLKQLFYPSIQYSAEVGRTFGEPAQAFGFDRFLFCTYQSHVMQTYTVCQMSHLWMTNDESCSWQIH